MERNIQSEEEFAHETVELRPVFLVPWRRDWKASTVALLH